MLEFPRKLHTDIHTLCVWEWVCVCWVIRQGFASIFFSRSVSIFTACQLVGNFNAYFIVVQHYLAIDNVRCPIQCLSGMFNPRSPSPSLSLCLSLGELYSILNYDLWLEHVVTGARVLSTSTSTSTSTYVCVCVCVCVMCTYALVSATFAAARSEVRLAHLKWLKTKNSNICAALEQHGNLGRHVLWVSERVRQGWQIDSHRNPFSHAQLVIGAAMPAMAWQLLHPSWQTKYSRSLEVCWWMRCHKMRYAIYIL